MLDLYEADPALIVWWATEVECVSALARLERDGTVPADALATVKTQLSELKRDWHEVDPVEPVRRTAQRLLRTHPLRTADALQLAAALAAAEGDPSSLDFVCLDVRLLDAARREGLAVIDAGQPDND